MKKFYILLVLMAIGGASYYLYNKNKKPEIVYREVSLDRGDIKVTIMASGTVYPQNRLAIKPPIAGRIDQVLVVEGQVVKKGQILAWMSSTERAALLDSARALGAEELKRWEDLYRAIPVVAPIDGTIILRNIEPGQSYATSDGGIFAMSDRLTVQAQVDETDLAQVKLKQPAEIILDAYAGETIKGSVAEIAYESKTVNNVTTYTVDIVPERTPEFMRSGMTANVIFSTATRGNVLRVPNEVIKTQGGKSNVLVKGLDNKPIPTEIITGLSDGRHTEVISGLKGNEILMVQVLNLEEEKSNNPFSPNIKKPGSGGKRNKK